MIRMNHHQPKEVRDIINYCHNGRKQLLIGCDANAHHTLWGNTCNNPREDSLVELLVSSNLNIFNHGNEHTFVICNKKEVIDLTLGKNKIRNLISNSMLGGSLVTTAWRVLRLRMEETPSSFGG
jgi:hypothetical protein